jgi:hypothetical protein
VTAVDEIRPHPLAFRAMAYALDLRLLLLPLRGE